jgi:hypothetical protein
MSARLGDKGRHRVQGWGSSTGSKPLTFPDTGEPHEISEDVITDLVFNITLVVSLRHGTGIRG